MIKASGLLNAVKKLELHLPNKRESMIPKQPLFFQLGSTEQSDYLKITFDISDFDKDKDMKTLTVNLSTEIAEIIDKLDKVIQKKANTVAKSDGIEWKSLVTQERSHNPQMKVKLYCKQNAPTRTRFYKWDGQGIKNNKPVLEPTVVDYTCAGQQVVLHLSVGQVYTFKGTRGVILYAKHVLFVDSVEDVDAVDFS